MPTALRLMARPVYFVCAGLLTLLPTAHAQPAAADAARISRVVVYPGAATVERTARVVPGQRMLSIACLPAGLDATAIQVHADEGVRVGELALRTQPRNAVAACASPLDERIRTLEDQLATLQAETAGLELAYKYLSTQATQTATADNKPTTASPQQLAATADALKRTTQDGQVRLHALQRQREALERTLQPLRDERERTAGQHSDVSTLTVQIASDREARVRVTYNLRGPGWQPSYRASLNPTNGQLVLERQALVAQNSGEDWADVALTLSTGQPGQTTQGRLPRPWTLDVAPPPRARSEEAMQRLAPMALAAPAPAPAAMRTADEADMPNFDTSTFDKTFATEFVVPQRITVPSSGQRVTLALGKHETTAQLRTRTTPAQEPVAYLIADLTPPPGVWPAGPVALYREGTLVGNGRLDFGQTSPDATPNQPITTLWFGRDERLRITVEPEQKRTSSTGLTNSGTERQVVRSYRIENRHKEPVVLQVLDAAPVSRNEAIEVRSTYQPQPNTTTWAGQPGSIAWQQTLGAGATARFSAEHTIRHSKDLQVLERP